jgi:hypothetical protein
LSSGAGTRNGCCVPDQLARPTSDDLIARIRELSVAVDTLWNDALNTAGDSQFLEIGEASQGLHRALIALDSFRSN